MNLGIYEDAERLALRYDTRDPFELLDAMHVVLEFSDSFEKTGLKGFCTVMNKTRYVVINGKLSSVEKRVVAAHEAGHLIRHASDLQIGAFKDNDIYMATGKKEREANVFAADFLIQDEDVLKRMKACDSNFFNVAKALRIPAPFFAFKLYSMVERGYRALVCSLSRTGQLSKGGTYAESRYILCETQYRQQVDQHPQERSPGDGSSFVPQKSRQLYPH